MNLPENHQSFTGAGNKPVGVFDSGLGGLTVVREILHTLPMEDIVYLGDTARVPYGVKSPDTVTKYALQNTHFLLGQQVKVVVVACNTASAFSLNRLRSHISLPCLGVIEPGARVAVNQTTNGRIGVIGTTGTISSQAYDQALKEIDPEVEVFSRACPLFVPLVEEAWIDNSITYKVAETYLAYFKTKDIDTLILGCTHYPLLKRAISDILGPKVTLVDSAVSLAEELRGVLLHTGLMNQKDRPGTLKLFVTDLPERFMDQGRLFLQRTIFPVEHIDLNNIQDDIQGGE
ncbi:MAG: glutamate racemase [bacterium]